MHTVYMGKVFSCVCLTSSEWNRLAQGEQQRMGGWVKDVEHTNGISMANKAYGMSFSWVQLFYHLHEQMVQLEFYVTAIVWNVSLGYDVNNRLELRKRGKKNPSRQTSYYDYI